MDTLQSIFPLVPIAALERVLDICDQSVEAASDWLLENDWQELIDEEDEQDEAHADHFEEDDRGGIQAVANGTNTRLNGDDQEHVNAATTGGASNALARIHAARAAVASPASSNGEPRGLTMAVSTESTLAHATNLHHTTAATVVHDQQYRHHQHHHQHHHNRHGRHHQGGGDAGADPDGDSEDGDEEDEDEDEDDDDDDDDDDEDDGDGNSYYDSGDDSYFHNSMPPLAKRVKVSRDEKTTNLESSEHFWASFDGQVVPKTLIELLNTTLTKLAHSSVMLLKKSSKQITEDEARDHLKSVLVRADEVAMRSNDSLDNNSHTQPGSLFSRILNAPPDAAQEEPAHARQKRKRVEEPSSSMPMGFFALFFSISDLDMVWRSILHAHVFNGRFGDLIEFHAASSGVFARRDFDELMHIHTNVSSSSRSASMGAASLSGLKCCLLLPCEATEEEIFRVGKHLHTLLKLPGSLYYRTFDLVGCENAGSNRDSNPADLLNEDGKLTEESFRRFARYRIKKEEVETTEAKNEKEAMGPDHFLAYQQQRKVDHCLQLLEKDSWVQRVSG